MKKVIKGKDLKDNVKYAIDLLCSTVKSTLGPSGNNTIINDANYTPFITNDGVTIAKSIEDDNPIVNTILSLIKEAAIKTDEDVGDGTTTTLVLLESIYNLGIKYINEGINPIKLKEELNESLEDIIKKIDLECKIPSKNDFYKIASVAANDEKIGKFLTNVFLKLKKSDNIKIKENYNSYEDYFEVIKGYFLPTNLASLNFFDNNFNIKFNNSFVALIDDQISFYEEIDFLINDAFSKNHNLVIFADSFSEEVINEVLAINYEQKNKIILINNPEYGLRKKEILKDLCVIFNTKINNLNSKDFSFGCIHEVNIDKDISVFNFIINPQITNYIRNLKKQVKNEYNSYELEFLNDRISKLKSIYGVVYVGGKTNLERREKKMRFDDALFALNAAKHKICLGGGLTYFKISDALYENNFANKIYKGALKEPLKQILYNCNINYEKIIEFVKNNNYSVICNVKNKTFESIDNSNVLDNKIVLEKALINATSIASLLLTTSHLVINEQNIKPNVNNFNDEI